MREERGEKRETLNAIFNTMQLFLLFFLGFFEVPFAVLLLEAFDSTCGIDEFLLAGVKRMTHRADFRMYFACGAASLKGISAAAMYDHLIVFWMYVFFHGKTPYL